MSEAANAVPTQDQPFEVRLELFDGPLDLLLHLVKTRELPIEQLSLAVVAGQYLTCIRSLRSFDVEVAGEYLVIAATLVSIKSSVLLDEPVEMIPDEDGNLVDPHEELVKRLQRLEVIRRASIALGGRPMFGVDIFGPSPRTVKIDTKLVPLADHSSELLVKAFSAVLEKLGTRQEMTILIDRVSVSERMTSVIEQLRLSGGSASLFGLLIGNQERGILIGTFLALLELCRQNLIRVAQISPEDDITVESVDSEIPLAAVGE